LNIGINIYMLKRTNEEWLSDLSSPGPSQESALADLRKIIFDGLPYSIGKYLPFDSPQFVPLADEVTQETLLRVLSRLDTFEGRSQFTTWVHKIAVRIALTELRRRKWRDVSLDEIVEEKYFSDTPSIAADTAVGPELSVEQQDMFNQIERLIKEELTDKQRRAITAISIQGMPIEEVARRMDTSRNALYKLLHDARLRLKQRMVKEGLTTEDVLSIFEQG
jgi:RNA polymerase sigma-70 factor (ECF subfamily)